MKKSLLFWHDWPPVYRYLVWLLFALLLVLALLVPALHILGADGLIPWHVFTREAAFAEPFAPFNIGPFSFSFTADKYVLLETFSGGKMPVSGFAFNWLVAALGMLLVLFLSSVSALRRFTFLVAMGLFMAFIISLQVQSTAIFNWPGNAIMIFFFAVLIIPAYYLHAFRAQMSFAKRLWLFTFLVLLLGLIIVWASDLYHPLYNLVGYGLMAFYLVVLVFIFTVAHEIVAMLLNVVAAAGTLATGVQLRHFIIISIIYLLNLVLLYLYRIQVIDWQLVEFNPFILLGISAILGIWGVRQRLLTQGRPQTEIYLYLVLYLTVAVFSFATLAYIVYSLNDPFVRVLADVIIFSHLAIGGIFFIYVLYNFIPLLEKGLDAGKVLYKPRNLPFFTYRVLSVMVFIGLYAVKGFEMPLWYSMGGHSNAKGDLALTNGHRDIARAYYENGNAYAHHNHKSNYMLGMLTAADEPDKAIEHFGFAAERQPSTHSFINKANVQNKVQDYYSALFTLQEAMKVRSGDVRLFNNLAMQYDRLQLQDSALYYLQKTGYKLSPMRNNRLALAARYHLSLGDDSLKVVQDLNHSGRANAAALGLDLGLPSVATADHMFDFAYLNNYLLNPAVATDSGLYRIRAVADSTADQEYRERLLYNWALAAANSGRARQAVEALQYLIYNSDRLSTRAAHALGLVYLHNRAYGLAAEALQALQPAPTRLARAVALLEDGEYEEARSYWIALADNPQSYLAGTARTLVDVLYQDSPALDDDRKLYLYIRYMRHYLDDSEVSGLLSRIADPPLRQALTLDMAAYYHDQDMNEAALRLLTGLQNEPLPAGQYRQFLLLSILVNPQPEYVQQQLSEFDSLFDFKPDEYLLELTLNHLAGMQLDSTDYLHLAYDNPFMADAVLIGVSFLSAKDPLLGYRYLAEAVQRNPESPVLLRAYIFSALENGMEQFAENALYEYGQRFAGQRYMKLRLAYEQKVQELQLSEEELDDLPPEE